MDTDAFYDLSKWVLSYTKATVASTELPIQFSAETMTSYARWFSFLFLTSSLLTFRLLESSETSLAKFAAENGSVHMESSLISFLVYPNLLISQLLVDFL